MNNAKRILKMSAAQVIKFAENISYAGVKPFPNKLAEHFFSITLDDIKISTISIRNIWKLTAYITFE